MYQHCRALAECRYATIFNFQLASPGPRTQKVPFVYELDITELVHKGDNRIELRLCNSLWNRLVGDATLQEQERTYWQTHPLAKPSDSLVPSGLDGDVTITVAGRK